MPTGVSGHDLPLKKLHRLIWGYTTWDHSSSANIGFSRGGFNRIPSCRLLRAVVSRNTFVIASRFPEVPTPRLVPFPYL